MKPFNTTLPARLGAISYAIWALLHLRVDPSMIQARLFQDAWNLACFSIAGLGIALTLNWRNDRSGYWLNLAVISVADMGFVIFVLLPGYFPVWPGLLGPIFWLLGLALTTLGYARGVPEAASVGVNP